MLQFSGQGSPADFYHEAVMRFWFCFCLPPESRAGLGLKALTLAGSPEADQAAFDLIQEEACEGDALAQLQMGLLTIAGCGVEADPDAGLLLVESAAEDGLPEAQYVLGNMFAKGDFVEADLGQAIEWIHSAAREDLPEAQERMVELLDAVEALRAGAEEGHADAQYRLGMLNWFGRAVHRNERQGRVWLMAAADQGHEAARDHLHFIDELLPALRRQAAIGEPAAQFELARQLMLDEMIPQDLTEAIVWLKRAACQGFGDATKLLATATRWDPDGTLLDDLRREAAAGEEWAIAALQHLPPGLHE